MNCNKNTNLIAQLNTGKRKMKKKINKKLK